MKLLKYLSRLSGKKRGEHMLSNRKMNELMDTYSDELSWSWMNRDEVDSNT